MRQPRTSNNQTELLSIVQSIQRHLESTRKQQNRITPAVARTLAMKIDNSIRKNGSSAISSNSISTKIDYIARMLMGVSSANLMNLSVSNKGGLLAKATLLKGIMSEEHLNSLVTYLNLLIDAQTPISFQNHMIMNDLYGSLIREYPSMRSLWTPAPVKSWSSPVRESLILMCLLSYPVIWELDEILWDQIECSDWSQPAPSTQAPQISPWRDVWEE